MTIEKLISIWERLLKLPSVGLEDNFFDLGGSPALAADLFREIADAGCRVLPPVAIYQAPTIRSLASLLANPAQLPQCPPVVLIRRGTENPPIFLAHGLGENVTQLFHIAKHIQLRNAIYGTQARGIDGLQEPLDRIEEMADFYLQAIRRVQLQGPYLLIGYSFGGLVMMEIAQRLCAEGQKIALLAMLDSYPHRTRISRGQQFSVLVRSATRRLFSSGRIIRKPSDDSTMSANEKQYNATLKSIRQRIYEGELIALEHYQPRFYPGKVNFVEAEIRSYFPEPRKVWTSLVQEFELETVPGDHIAMVTTHYKSIAELLTLHLLRALNEKGSRSNKE
jgi:thioesterase domain-containing protein